MTKTTRIFLSFSLLALMFAACAPKPDPGIQVRQAVAATIAAIPTYTPYPLPTAYPSPTPLSLAGLFCEYQFCIGHPPDMAFFDVSGRQDPTSPSTYGQGLIATYNANLFIEVIWQLSPGTTDPQFMLDLILDDEVDARSGNLDIQLIDNMNVLYAPIASNLTPILPYGGIAAWTCGDRAFAWKAYTPQADQASRLFQDALARFAC